MEELIVYLVVFVAATLVGVFAHMVASMLGGIWQKEIAAPNQKKYAYIVWYAIVIAALGVLALWKESWFLFPVIINAGFALILFLLAMMLDFVVGIYNLIRGILKLIFKLLRWMLNLVWFLAKLLMGKYSIELEINR